MRPVKIVGKVLAGLLAAVLLLIAGFTGYHHVMLHVEAGRLHDPGQLVTVADQKMSVRAEGPVSDKPTIVLISGASTASPILSFEPLTKRLDTEFHTVVVERFGYGYSDDSERDRHLATVLADTRAALHEAGEAPPYVLAPHSMGGLEALYWAQTYPQEVAGIVGLDMAVPHSYDSLDFDTEKSTIETGRKLRFFGVSRVMGSDEPTHGLTKAQLAQQQMLVQRNFLDDAQYHEGLALLDNAATVQDGGIPDVPMLMFVSNGQEIGDFWVPASTRFAHKAGAELTRLDVGHYVFQYQPQLIAQQMATFVDQEL